LATKFRLGEPAAGIDGGNPLVDVLPIAAVSTPRQSRTRRVRPRRRVGSRTGADR
jgi:hypothetical protein